MTGTGIRTGTLNNYSLSALALTLALLNLNSGFLTFNGVNLTLVLHFLQ